MGADAGPEANGALAGALADVPAANGALAGAEAAVGVAAVGVAAVGVVGAAVGEADAAGTVGDAIGAVAEAVTVAGAPGAEATPPGTALTAPEGLAALAAADAEMAGTEGVPVLAELAGAIAGVIVAAIAGALAVTGCLGALATPPTVTAGVQGPLAGVPAPAGAVLSCKRDRSEMFFDNSATRSLLSWP